MAHHSAKYGLPKAGSIQCKKAIENMSDTLKRIQTMLGQQYQLAPERLGPDQPLADLGIDSLTTIEFMFTLEDEFSIRLSDEKAAIETVNDIAKLVDAMLQKKTAPV